MIATMRGLPIPMIDEGSGSPIIFLHGTPDNKAEWIEVIDLLKNTYRCIAPDLPGFGDWSQIPPGYDFSIESQIAFLEAFIQQVVGEEKVTLVVHDIGAIMGLAWATRHADQVERIIVMNVVFHTDYRWHGFGKIMSSPILSKLFMMVINRKRFSNSFRKDFPLVRQDQVDRIYDGIASTTKTSLHRMFRQMTKPDFFQQWEPKLEAITRQIPTRILWGKQDPLIPKSYAQRIGDNLRMIDDCGHWIPLVKPNVVAEEIRTFNMPK